MKLNMRFNRPCSMVGLKNAITSGSVSCRMKDRIHAMPTNLELELPSLQVENAFPREKLGKNWMEYQGSRNWEGLLDPLDENLRGEIIRYGEFVRAAYSSFNFDQACPTYATCKFPKHSLLRRSGLPETGYRTTRNLHATSGIQMPRWANKAPSWLTKRSGWIGYVAVCEDEEEIARLGRRDVVIAYRGTATCMEWLENLRGMMTQLPDATLDQSSNPMVESGFWSLYTSRGSTCPSLSEEIREEIGKILENYGGQPLSITVTGHSLGAALALLTAYDITTAFPQAPPVTVISFGGPRVGNRSFGWHVEQSGTKVLRVVNTQDLITKLPPTIGDDDVANNDELPGTGLPNWLAQSLDGSPWVYADVGRELRVSIKDCPYLNHHVSNVAKCHDLDVYLQLVNGFLSSTCPFDVKSKPDLFDLISGKSTLETQKSGHTSRSFFLSCR